LLGFFNLSQDFANVAVLAFFNLLDLSHDILEQVLHEHLSLLVASHALINLDADHLRHLIRYLHLVVLETIDFVPDRIVDFGNLSTQIHFLLGSSHLFLPNPAIDASDLGLEVGVDGLDCLVFTLELVTNVAVHLIVSLAHFLHSLSALFSLHSVFDVDLVANILNLPRSFLLLSQKPIH